MKPRLRKISIAATWFAVIGATIFSSPRCSASRKPSSIRRPPLLVLIGRAPPRHLAHDTPLTPKGDGRGPKGESDIPVSLSPLALRPPPFVTPLAQPGGQPRPEPLDRVAPDHDADVAARQR